MNFQDAMSALKAGSKVTRSVYHGELYFKVDGDAVRCFQPSLSHFHYDADIMLSTGWEIDNNGESYSFPEVISFLQAGSSARLKAWEDSYIYLDVVEQIIVLSAMNAFPFKPSLADFIAPDWMIM